MINYRQNVDVLVYLETGGKTTIPYTKELVLAGFNSGSFNK